MELGRTSPAGLAREDRRSEGARTGWQASGAATGHSPRGRRASRSAARQSRRRSPEDPRRTLSVDGNETTLQTNYLAPFLLTTILRHLLEGGHRSRIVNVASATHLSATLQLDDLGLTRHEYTPVRAYTQSKLALVTYSCALAKQLGAGPCEAVSLHPGVITTRLLDSLFHMQGDPPAQAAANIIHVASTDERVNGRYYDEQRPAQPNPAALDTGIQQALLRISIELTSP